MIDYKNDSVLRSLLIKGWNPILIDVLIWLEGKYPKHLLLTQGYEDRDYPSTHSVDPLRAFDIRSTVFDKPQEIVDYINSIWIYDPDRLVKKVAIFHDVGRGQHIHIQVHENTIKKVLI